MARSDFSLTHENAQTIAEICARLDGLPLALELAAARLKILSADALLTRLGKRLNLLTGGRRDVPARQQTLRDAISWSYELLTPDERRLFRRLAPLNGGFLLDAADALSAACVGDETGSLESNRLDVLDGIASLVDKSLLRPAPSNDNQRRFTMLETIREYALERLHESGEKEVIHKRHARFYLHLVEMAEPGYFGGNWTDLIARLDIVHDNFRAALQSALTAGEEELALRLAAALAWFWYDHGHLSEGRRWLAIALSGAPSAPSIVRAKALIGAGALAHRQYDLVSARKHLEAGLQLSRRLGDDWNTALALINLGLVIHDQGDYVLARRLHEESLALSRSADNAWGSESLCLTLPGRPSSPVILTMQRPSPERRSRGGVSWTTSSDSAIRSTFLAVSRWTRATKKNAGFFSLRACDTSAGSANAGGWPLAWRPSRLPTRPLNTAIEERCPLPGSGEPPSYSATRSGHR